MTIINTPFNNVFLLEATLNKDIRGGFMEYHNHKNFKASTGHDIQFCQDNLTYSKRGVLRGLHYQLPPYSQSKLVSVIQGEGLDVIVDVRKGSPTFGQHFSQLLNDKNQLQIFIPRGFAHGFITLSETSIFAYKVDQYYNPQSEGSIAPDDPFLNIDWKLDKKNWILSDKDRQHPYLEKARLFDFKEDLYA